MKRSPSPYALLLILPLVISISGGSSHLAAKTPSKYWAAKDGETNRIILRGGGVEGQGKNPGLGENPEPEEEVELTQHGHSDEISAVSYSVDGNNIVTGSHDGTVKLWDAETGKELKTFTIGHTIESVAYHPSGQLVACAGESKVITVLDLRSEKTVREFTTDSFRVEAVVISPDGKLLSYKGVNGEGDVWEIESGRHVMQTSGYGPLAFSPDGETLIYGDGSRGVFFQGVRAGGQLRHLEGIGHVGKVAFSTDGGKLAITADEWNLAVDRRYVSKWIIAVYDWPAGNRLYTITDEPSGYGSIQFSPDGKNLINGGGGRLSVWDAANGRLIRSWVSDVSKEVTFNPDGRTFAALDDSRVGIFNFETGARVRLLTGLYSEFRVSMLKHSRELRELLLARGDPHLIIDNTAYGVTDVLNGYYPRNTAILFYSYESERLRIYEIYNKGIEAYHSQKISRDDIERAANDLRVALGVIRLIPLSQTRARPGNVPDILTGGERLPMAKAIANLSDILLPAPIAKSLTGVEHLIIVPVLGIGTVPFALLKPFPDGSYLVDRMTVSIAPSLFDVGQSGVYWDGLFPRPESRYGGRRPTPAGHSLIVGYAGAAGDPDEFPGLPGAEAEAREVAGMIGARPLIGRAVTKAAVRRAALRSSVLYFATHGVASSDDPLNGSYLVLNGAAGAEGRWTAKEIQSLDLNAQIAVLSACQTGLGKVHDAGIIGLARAFQLAGTPRVVMSLWNVSDEATRKLMVFFVSNLKKRVMPAEALRRAMMAYKKQEPDPAKWASFILFGTPR